MRFFFFPGTFSELSLEELKSVFAVYIPNNYLINSKSNEVFVVTTTADEKKMVEIFHRLGGFIKFGVEVDQEKFLNEYIEQNIGQSIMFGVNVYGRDYPQKEQEKLSITLKKALKGAGVDARFLNARDGALTSAQILNNNLIDKGFDLNIIHTASETIVGRTLAIQDIDAFVERDMEKPQVDTQMGVLPPKLARIMVNLAECREGETIWDPFCGSGNILTEAMVLGYDVLGSDIDYLALDNSRKNIGWLAERYDLIQRQVNIFYYDVVKGDRKIESRLRKTPIGALVFEPYMGPPQKRILNEIKARKLLGEVQRLYSSFFAKIERINKPNLRVVAILPSYKTFNGWKTLRYSDFMSKKWEVVSKKDLHWDRNNSIIRRNIFVVQLKK